MSFHHSPQIVTNGLLLHIDAISPKSYDGSGTVWKDLINNRQLSLLGSPTFSTSPTCSFQFNPASSQHVNFDVTNITQLKTENFLANNNTISIWVNLSSRFGTQYDATESTQGLVVWPGWHSGMYISSTYITFNIWNSGTTGRFEHAYSLSAVPDKWYHFLHTYDKTNSISKWYIDGINVQTITSVLTSTPFTSAQGTPPNTVNIGAARLTPTHRWLLNGGKIANVSLYNRVLTDTEVLQNYNALKGRFGL